MKNRRIEEDEKTDRSADAIMEVFVVLLLEMVLLKFQVFREHSTSQAVVVLFAIFFLVNLLKKREYIMGRTGLQRGRYTYILNDIDNHFARIK